MSREEKSYSEEYASYLERYELFGEGQPKRVPRNSTIWTMNSSICWLWTPRGRN